MNYQSSNPSAAERNSAGLLSCAVLSVTILSLFTLIPSAFSADKMGKCFATPAEAVGALGKAVNGTDRAAFVVLFGPDSEWLSNPDTVQGDREVKEFAAAFNATNRVVQESERWMTLEVGANAWPFPIPIVKTTNGWCFDTEAGRDETLNRRIGHNELEVLRVMRGYVEAQREYASQDRDGDEVLEYAQKISSSPGRIDGLFWPPELNGEISPLGPWFAQAQSEGYFGKKADPEAGPQPFYGYLFKLLTRQGNMRPAANTTMSSMAT